jgi:hypothetical protein
MSRKTHSNSVSRIEFSCFVHATEDESKVTNAVLNLFPEELREDVTKNIYKMVTHGYHGNPIVILHVLLSSEKDSENTFSHIVSSLSEDDFQSLVSTIPERFDHGKLYIRVDKQKAYGGNVSLSESDDVIRIVVSLKPHLRSPQSIENFLISLRKAPTRAA